ncbi:MAG: hypothetical protein M0P20_03815 [Methanocorpusculum sp.]|jgi:hypothetical protein|nr:hypothetical protein [Methanocorpusculum sp.]MDD2471187.1 hypothetical protein [Methanocorpusculum sp.]
MNVRDIIPEILLILLMAVSAIVVVSRLWQDAIISVGILLLILAFGGLCLQLLVRLRRLEEASVQRERILKGHLEDLGRQLIAKQDQTSKTVIETVDSIKMRMYR